jgi:hypothetical protein
MRREPGGPVYDRMEPDIRGINFSIKDLTESNPQNYSILALEYLYAHYQGDKYERESNLLTLGRVER